MGRHKSKKNKDSFGKIFPVIAFALLAVFFLSACSHIAQQPAESKYDNLSLGVPAKADTIIDRPSYALGYIEYHEQPAWMVSHFRVSD